MNDKLNQAKDLLYKTFIQKGSNFQNLVTFVSLNKLDEKQIIITY